MVALVGVRWNGCPKKHTKSLSSATLSTDIDIHAGYRAGPGWRSGLSARLCSVYAILELLMALSLTLTS